MNEDLFCEDNLKTLRFEGFFFLDTRSHAEVKKSDYTQARFYNRQTNTKKNQWDSLLYAVRDRDC